MEGPSPTPVRASTRAYGVRSPARPTNTARATGPPIAVGSPNTPQQSVLATNSSEQSLDGLIQEIRPQSGNLEASETYRQGHSTNPSSAESGEKLKAAVNSQQKMKQTPAPKPASHPHTHRHKAQKRSSIGPWDFVKSIGAGSMGQVKLAIHRYTRQMAAVKIVPKAYTQRRTGGGGESDEAKDARIIREGAIGQLLYHPNIARLYDVYSMTSHWYLVFEYVAGGQMLDYIITHGCVKEQQARRFARGIVSALDYCHHNSIVHRDLKIENVLINDDGEVKLIDFGLSNLFYRDNLLKTFCGSLYFAAPELLNAQPYVGPEVDVWSLGVVLYVLVSGKVPFEDRSMTVLHAKIKRGVVEYPTWLSSQCVDLLSRMLVVAPSERATLYEVIHHPWMVKGFDGPVDPHIPRREPIERPLNRAVIHEMSTLGLGQEETIEIGLERILQSSEYNNAVKQWRLHKDSGAWNSRFQSPLDSYAPSLSMYFLTMERLQRASSEASYTSRARSRTVGEQSRIIPPVIGVGNIEMPRKVDLPTASAAPAAPPAPAAPEKAALKPGFSTPKTPQEFNHQSLLENVGQYYTPQVTQAPPSPRSDLSSLFRKISIRKRGSQHNDSTAGKNSNRRTVTPLQRGQSQQVRSHVRAKSTGHAAFEMVEHAGSTSDMPSIASPKPVFFRGFFSVQSTSTKPLAAIRTEIIRVLTDKKIEFVEIRGGFSCISRNSSPQTPSAPSTPSTPSRRGHSKIPSTGSVDDSSLSVGSVEMDIGASDMLGNKPVSVPIRFEISIVRVPIVGLHGVQFKKLTGNVWHYKNVAQDILAELHL